MGRQIAVAGTHADELAFLAFVRSCSDVRIAVPSAPAEQALWVESFADGPNEPLQYWLWNTTFPWSPTTGRINEDVRGTGGWYFLKNIHTAPAVEFVRTDWSKPQYGRLYWAKDFAAPNGLDYDVASFTDWYDLLAGWLRKNGRRLPANKHSPYFLPDAWQKLPKA